MLLSLWLAYLGAISLLILIPGPSAILCLNHGAKEGAVRTLPVVLGGIFGSLTLMGASFLGLGMLLQTSAILFVMVKILGAAYLIFMGVRMWRARHESMNDDTFSAVQAGRSLFSRIRLGFWVSISNPKDIIFFGALFSNFISSDGDQGVQILILSATWVVVDSTVMTLYAALGLRIKHWFAAGDHFAYFNRFTGGLFIAVGSLLALSSRANA